MSRVKGRDSFCLWSEGCHNLEGVSNHAPCHVGGYTTPLSGFFQEDSGARLPDILIAVKPCTVQSPVRVLLRVLILLISSRRQANDDPGIQGQYTTLSSHNQARDCKHLAYPENQNQPMNTFLAEQ